MFGTSSLPKIPALFALISSPALLLSLTYAPAFAQSPEFLPETVIEAADEQPFNPGTGTLADPNKVPYTLSLQPAEPGETARDALRWDPAISAQTGNGVFDFFTLRGFDSLTAVNVAIDGVVEPETSFYHLHNMEQVQVAKGPFSTYFGRDALAGNVNLVRKQPHGEQDLRLGVEAGSFGHVQVDADLNFPSLTRLNLLYKAADGYRDDMDSEAYNVTVAQGWNLSERSDITAHFDFTHNEYTPDSGIPTLGPQLVPGISDKANFQSDGEFSEQDIIRIAVNLESELNDTWSLQNRAYFTDFEWQSSGSIFAGFAKFGAGLEAQPMSLARIRPELDDHQQIIGNNLSFRGDLGSHQVLVGAEVRRLTDEFTLPLNPISDINVFTGETSQGIIPPIPGQAGDAELNEYSIYAVDQVRLSDTLSVLGGVRGQIFEFEDSELGTERDDEKVSGSAGLPYRPTEETSYYINAGTAYATPSTQVQGPRGEPEESVSVEGGVKYQAADGSLGGSLAAFTIDRDNIAIPTSTGVLAANGTQTASGIEANVQTRLADSIQLAVGYAYLDAELEDFAEFDARGRMDFSGNVAAFAPEHTVTLRSIFDVTESVSLNAGLIYQDEQFIAPDNGFKIDAQTYTELGATYTQEKWLGRITLRNVLDEELYGRGSGATSVRPEDGFGIFGRIETRF